MIVSPSALEHPVLWLASARALLWFPADAEDLCPVSRIVSARARIIRSIYVAR